MISWGNLTSLIKTQIITNQGNRINPSIMFTIQIYKRKDSQINLTQETGKSNQENIMTSHFKTQDSSSNLIVAKTSSNSNLIDPPINSVH
jgi:hypothetical protein